MLDVDLGALLMNPLPETAQLRGNTLFSGAVGALQPAKATKVAPSRAKMWLCGRSEAIVDALYVHSWRRHVVEKPKDVLCPACSSQKVFVMLQACVLHCNSLRQVKLLCSFNLASALVCQSAR